MALSKSVSDSLREAEGNLRNALAYAARQERPLVCTSIAKLIQEMESIQTFDDIIDKLESREPGDSDTWGPIID